MGAAPARIRCTVDPPKPRPPVTPALVARAFQRIPLPLLRSVTQPADKTLINFDTIFFVDAQPLHRTLYETAQLRILLVTPEGRGLGLGRELVDRTVAFARAAGYRRLVLWTNEPLAAARRIYLERGFRLVDEERHHSFGVDLVGQNYVLAL